MLRTPGKTKDRPVKLTTLISKAGASELSSIGTVVSRIIKIIRDPDASISTLREQIEIDPPLSAKILRRANSAYYGIKRNITSIHEAIVIIGFNPMKELILSLKISKLFDGTSTVHNYSRKELWKHSLGVALSSKYIYRREFREHGESVYSAALLHDIGLMVEEQFAYPQFKQALKMADEDNISLYEAEKTVFGFTHPRIAGQLTQNWNFPEELVKPIEAHHKPAGLEDECGRLARVIFISDFLCCKNNIGYCEIKEGNEDEYQQYLEELNLNQDSLDIIIEDIQEELEEMEARGELYL